MYQTKFRVKPKCLLCFNRHPEFSGKEQAIRFSCLNIFQFLCNVIFFLIILPDLVQCGWSNEVYESFFHQSRQLLNMYGNRGSHWRTPSRDLNGILLIAVDLCCCERVHTRDILDEPLWQTPPLHHSIKRGVMYRVEGHFEIDPCNIKTIRLGLFFFD